jgi:molecular chaperone DnaJ
MEKNYYRTLGVRQADSPADIRSAFKSLCLRFYPAHDPGNQDLENHFAELAEAFEVLANDHKRALYDHLGYARFVAGVTDKFGNKVGGFEAKRHWKDVYLDFLGENEHFIRPVGAEAGFKSYSFDRVPFQGFQPKNVQATITVSLLDLLIGKRMEVEFSRTVLKADGVQTQSVTQKKLLNQVSGSALGLGLQKTDHFCRRRQRRTRRKELFCYERTWS